MFSKKKRWFWTSLFTSESVWDFSKRTLDSVCNYMFTMQVAKWLSSLKINDSTEFCVDDQIKTALMNFFFLTVGQMAPCMVKKIMTLMTKKKDHPALRFPSPLWRMQFSQLKCCFWLQQAKNPIKNKLYTNCSTGDKVSAKLQSLAFSSYRTDICILISCQRLYGE